MKRLVFYSMIAMTGCMANAETFRFDTPDSMNRFQSVHGGDGSGAWTWSATAGLGGSGGIQAENYPETSVLVLKEGFKRQLGSPAHLKVHFQWTEPLFGVGHGFYVGIAPGPGILPGKKDGKSAEYLYVGIGRREEKNSARLVGASNNAAGERAMYHSPDTVPMEPGAWYRLDAELVPDGERVRVALRLEKVNADGTGGEISQFEFLSYPVPGILAATQWFPFMGSDHHALRRGVQAVDELTIE